ncbi:MAG: ester cyclase, partial [Bacteroidota bacterium]|nr:ester cyclase [Bacteroidota bacterium]
LISCNEKSGKDTIASSNSSASNTTDDRKQMEANSEQVYRAIETGNFTGIDTTMAPDIIEHSGPHGEIKGRDSVIASLKQISVMNKNVKVETLARSYDPATGYIFSMVRRTGTTVTPMDGMPANTPYDVTAVDVVKVKDGKATEHWGYVDPNAMMKMMGKQPGEKK